MIFLPSSITALNPSKKTPTPSKRRRHNPLSTCWRGGSTVATPAMSPPLFLPIKTGEREEKAWKKKGRERPKTEQERNKGEEEKRENRTREGRGEEKTKKQRRERKKKEKHRRLCRPQLPSSTAGHRKPPVVPPLHVNPLPFYFGLHFFPRHARRAQCASAGGEKLVTVLMHSNQLMWAGLSQPM